MERIRVRHETRGLGWWVAMYDMDLVIVFDTGVIAMADRGNVTACNDNGFAPGVKEKPEPARRYEGAM